MHLFVNVCMRRWILPRARQCSGAASTSTLSHFHSSFSVCDVDAVQYIRAGSISLCSLSPAPALHRKIHHRLHLRPSPDVAASLTSPTHPSPASYRRRRILSSSGRTCCDSLVPLVCNSTTTLANGDLLNHSTPQDGSGKLFCRLPYFHPLAQAHCVGLRTSLASLELPVGSLIFVHITC